MAMADFQLNQAQLIAIANEVNTSVCKPLAEEAAQRARADAESFSVTGAYRDSIHVEIEERTTWEGWARSKVVADAPHAARVESRHGTLEKSLQ